MTEQPEPTRAEVSDVATATILQADALALRDETANGNFPIEAVKMMKRVINYAEQHMPVETRFVHTHSDSSDDSVGAAIARSIIELANAIDATAIVAETKSGATAINIAKRRPKQPIIAVTSSRRVAQQLAIVYGVKSYVRKDGKLQATKLTEWLRKNNVLEKGDRIVTASENIPVLLGQLIQ